MWNGVASLYFAVRRTITGQTSTRSSIPSWRTTSPPTSAEVGSAYSSWLDGQNRGPGQATLGALRTPCTSTTRVGQEASHTTERAWPTLSGTSSSSRARGSDRSAGRRSLQLRVSPCCQWVGIASWDSTIPASLSATIEKRGEPAGLRCFPGAGGRSGIRCGNPSLAPGWDGMVTYGNLLDRRAGRQMQVTASPHA